MRAILIGATGLTGGILLKQLLTDPVFSHVKIIGRRTTGVKHTKLEECIIDFNDAAAFEQATSGGDVLFCCIGTTQTKVKGDKTAYKKVDFDIAVNAARYGARNGLSKFLLISSVGANAASSNFYLRLKGETESAILSQPINTVYIMRPSLLLGNRKEPRIAERIAQPVMQFFSRFLIGDMARYKAIDASELASAMRAAAKETTTGKFICSYVAIKKLCRKN
ncbi:MAG: NAD(P)H-binding protein [Chitinophagaceae bacterium]